MNYRKTKSSSRESRTRADLTALFAARPIPDEDLLDHIEVFMRPQRIGEILALNSLYQEITDVHGIIVEFGVRWGRHLSVFNALRTYYEPTNFYRKIVGFDTFQGFLEPSPLDGESDRVYSGSMAVTPDYAAYLEKVLVLQEAETSMSHIRRFELCAGDAPAELEKYLARNPDTIVALAYFDMDLHDPTLSCLDLLRPHMPVGSVIAFDELMHPDFPGEAIALKSAVDITKHRIRRSPHSPYPAYIVL